MDTKYSEDMSLKTPMSFPFLRKNELQMREWRRGLKRR